MISKTDIRTIKSLADKRARIQHKSFIVEGHKIVEELTLSELTITKIYTTHNSHTLNNILCESISEKEMSRISHLKSPTDYLAVAHIPQYPLDTTQLNNKLTIALDDIQDPGNLGTIIRIANWFGIEHILCSPASADCFNPKVVQATMGALLRVKLHYCDLDSILTKINAPIYGTFLEGSNIYDERLSTNGVIVMGNEGRGISQEITQLITQKLFIPPFPLGVPTSESLNVATASAIICSEFRRR